jgi:hypothetical protein
MFILRDPYQPKEFVAFYTSKRVGGDYGPSFVGIVDMGETARAEELDNITKRLHRMPRRLRAAWRRRIMGYRFR